MDEEVKEKMDHKPTILIANGTMNAGGTETLIVEILRHQTGKVKYILLVHYQSEIQKGIFDDEIRALGVQIVYIPSVGTLGIKGYCKKFKEVVVELGTIDIIHSHLNANGGVICLAAKEAGIKHRICHCHAAIRYKGSKTKKIKEEIALQVLRLYVNHFANHFWACSDAAWHRLFYPWKTEVVIPNMIDVEKYLSSPEEKEKAKATINMQDKFVVGSVGRVARIKNYELALEALALLNNNGQETHFVCYGRFDEKDAYCAELLTLADQLQIADKVHFMGNTIQVAKDIKAFDVFLMPSTTEGFGMAAIEAQAAGIPTLLSNGVPRIVDIEVGLATFLPLEHAQAWVEAVIGAKECNRPGNGTIVKCFDEIGYNSVSMVTHIEDHYLQIIK